MTAPSPRQARDAWWYDDLLAWLCPGGLLLTALALRFPEPLRGLRALAPELTLPTWFVGAYALGLALSPLGRVVYAFAQAIVWPRLRGPWTWTWGQAAVGALAFSICLIAAVYRERRRQRTQLSIWRRSRIG